MLRNVTRAVAIVVTTLALYACGGGGGGSSPSSPAPTVSLTASATDVQKNGSVTLTWSSTNATSCTASGGWTGALATSGSQSQTVTTTSTFTLTCKGSGGSGSGSAAVTAWNAPVPTISADQTNILSNNTVALTWSSQNATACIGADALSGVLATSGSQTSASLTTTTIFSVSCSNPVYAAVKASVTVDVSSTFTATLTFKYEVPGAPVPNAARTYYVPDWANPVAHPVPFVSVEVQNPAGQIVQQAYADVNGIATLSGLDPTVVYTPVVRSRISEPTLGLDFVVVNNTAPVNTSQPSYRLRYALYAGAGPAYTPDKRLASQNIGTLTAPDGWDSTQKTLVDANRFAAPFALLANAVHEAQIVSAAIGGSPAWRPLTILWSIGNKGGLAAPPNQMDNGLVPGSGGYYNSGHAGVAANGLETGAFVAEDHEFISGDQAFEPMDIYPSVLVHEMGHFTQRLFSTDVSPGGGHSLGDYEDPTLAWSEGSASGIAAITLGTPEMYFVDMVGGELTVTIVNQSNYTVNNGSSQSWPLGWYQEMTITRLMWGLYDPAGAMKLSAATVLAPMYTSAWMAGPWLSMPWAYTVQLAKLNPSTAAAIGSLADSLNILTTGNDEWGATESSPGNRSTRDALPPYTTVSIGGGPVTICSAGAPNDYNKESNVRYIKVTGDGANHYLSITGPTGTVPLLKVFPLGTRYISPGSNTLAGTVTVPSGVNVYALGDCRVALSAFTTDTAACNEPATTPAEQCWTVSIQ
jgi:hypothetical protein